jgi:hypothetical protein
MLPMLGFWEEEGPRIPFCAQATVDASGFEMEVLGAGIPLRDGAVLSRLSRLGREPGTESGSGLESLGLGGELDFRARLSGSTAVQENEVSSLIELHPRNARLDLEERPFLAGIHGRLLLADGRLSGPRLRAILGRTAVELRNLSLVPSSEGGALETEVETSDLPLDAMHLSSFLPEELLRSLIDDLRWRGKMDVEHGRLRASWSAQEPPRVSFRGDLRVSDFFVQVGLPLAVRSALAPGVELIYENGKVRAWGELSDLYAQMDGRRLDDASMVASFIQPRLVVERFDGRFEGGRLSSLGTEAGSGTGGCLTLNLEPPYPFGLSIETIGVDLEGLLRGLFNSDFANQGKLRGRLRLNGETEDLGRMRGQGYVELSETSLWSIPVFQALFSQLGFDSTAVFDQMRCSFQVEDGRVRMRNMRAESPLLRLVGEGSLGFDGSLDHDLEVRYALVDQLGPVTRLLYWIQRSLLRVSIRGDMERPKVVLKGLLPTFFDLGSAGRELPVPRFSELPSRF